MKKFYYEPLASVVNIETKDIMTASITLRGNLEGNDDKGSLSDLFGTTGYEI